MQLDIYVAPAPTANSAIIKVQWLYAVNRKINLRWRELDMLIENRKSGSISLATSFRIFFIIFVKENT